MQDDDWLSRFRVLVAPRLAAAFENELGTLPQNLEVLMQRLRLTEEIGHLTLLAA
jgi:hypothetical protein